MACKKRELRPYRPLLFQTKSENFTSNSITRTLPVHINRAVMAVFLSVAALPNNKSALFAFDVRVSMETHILISEIAKISNFQNSLPTSIQTLHIDIDVIHLPAKTDQSGRTKVIQHERLPFDRRDHVGQLENLFVLFVHPSAVFLINNI